MTATVTITCPNGCVSLEVSGHHEGAEDLVWLEEEALPEGYEHVKNRLCPECRHVMDLDVEE